MKNIDQFVSTVSHAIARRIREVREGQGLSQQAVADELTARGHKFSRLMVTHTEAAGRPITVEDLAALAVVFGVPVTHFFMTPDDTEAQALNDQLLTVQATDVMLEGLATQLQQARAELAQQERHLTARRAALGA